MFTPVSSIEQLDFCRGMINFATTLPRFRQLEELFMGVQVEEHHTLPEEFQSWEEHASDDQRHPFGQHYVRLTLSRIDYEDIVVLATCSQSTKAPAKLDCSLMLRVEGSPIRHGTGQITIPLHVKAYDYDKAMAAVRQDIEAVMDEAWDKRDTISV